MSGTLAISTGRPEGNGDRHAAATINGDSEETFTVKAYP